jgi:hypothetical protein
MSLKARCELLAATAQRYQVANKPAKKAILNESTTATEYHRKYAITLLKNYQPNRQAKHSHRRKKSRKYTMEVQDALVLIWEADSRICSKRLVPFLPEMITAMDRYGHLSLSSEVRAQYGMMKSPGSDRSLYYSVLPPQSTNSIS